MVLHCGPLSDISAQIVEVFYPLSVAGTLVIPACSTLYNYATTLAVTGGVVVAVAVVAGVGVLVVVAAACVAMADAAFGAGVGVGTPVGSSHVG